MDETHLVEVVLVQLPDKRGKVGVLEHAGKNRLRELIHILSKGASTETQSWGKDAPSRQSNHHWDPMTRHVRMRDPRASCGM